VAGGLHGFSPRESQTVEAEQRLLFAPALRGLPCWNAEELVCHYHWGLKLPLVPAKEGSKPPFEARRADVNVMPGGKPCPSREVIIKHFKRLEDYEREVAALSILALRPCKSVLQLESYGFKHGGAYYLVFDSEPITLALWINENRRNMIALKDRDLAVRFRAAVQLGMAVQHLHNNNLGPVSLAVSPRP
jgi:hypothetical protein